MQITTRVPVVAALAYVERVRGLPEAFSATLSAEPDNRYFRYAIAVNADGAKIGYVAPEIAPHYYDAVKTAPSPISCPARRAAASDHDTSGVELLLDLSSVPVGDPN